jgi:hypothetical protein
MARKKKNEATLVASSRSRLGQAEEDKIKEQLTAKLPEWARDLPEYITIRNYTIN